MNAQVDIGRVINRVFEIYVDQAPVLMPAAAVVFLITGVLGVVLLLVSPFLALVWIVLSLLATTLFTGMIVELVADVQDGRRDASVGRLLRAVTPVIWQLVLVGFVAGVGILVGLFLLIVPGLILLTIWSVAAPVVVLERPGGLRALSRSRALVRGHGWEVFAVLLVFVLGVAVLGGVIEALAGSAGAAAGLVARVIVGVLTAPLSALAAAVLYFELGGRAPSGPPAGQQTGTMA